MASITSLKASDGTGNASVATVQSVRSSGATTLVVDTVQGINTKFHATMGTPHTFVDPVTSETITVISEATAVDFAGHVDGSNLEIDTIAPGFTDAGSAVNDIVIIKPTTQWADQVATVLNVAHDDDGTLKAGAVDNAAVLASNVVETPKIKDGAVTGSKITNYKIVRQDDTTNTTETTSRILSGWGVISINTSTRTYLETVTFDTAFTGRPIVVGSCGGDGLTANGSTYGKGGSNIVNGWYCKVVEITTSSFQVYLATEAGNPGAAGYLWYQWIAIGV